MGTRGLDGLLGLTAHVVTKKRKPGFRGVLVDPRDQTCVEVSVLVPTLESIPVLLHCRRFDAPFEFENRDTLYCDEEALTDGCRDPWEFFYICRYPQPIYGRALILGSDFGGFTADARSPVEIIRERVEFGRHRALAALLLAVIGRREQPGTT